MKLLTPDQCARAELLSRSHGTTTVAELIGVHRSTIWRTRNRNWRDYLGCIEKRRRPADFAIQARHMTHRELRRHYGAASATVTRWKREAGL